MWEAFLVFVPNNDHVQVGRVFGYELHLLLCVRQGKGAVLNLCAEPETVFIQDVLCGFKQVSSLFVVQRLFFCL